MPYRSRDKSLCFRVTEEERRLIENKMKLAGIRSLRAYMTKMAIDGYVVQIDLSEVKVMVSLLRNSTSNINQIAKRLNETNNLYAQDILDLQQNYDTLWERMKLILQQLTHIVK